MSRANLLILNGVTLTGCAVFFVTKWPLLLTALMLFLPFLDKKRTLSNFSQQSFVPHYWLIPISFIIFLLIIAPSTQTSLVSIILFTALPEEWFFRAYFQKKIEILCLQGNFHPGCSLNLFANIITSLFFVLLHLPLQGVVGISVFIPSLFLGWLYQRKQDIVLVILTHSLFNIFYIVFIQSFSF